MNGSLELTKCVLIYEHGPQAICTVNPVRMAKGYPTIGPGVTLSRVGLDSLVRKLSGAPLKRQLLPERVLFVDGARMAWWSPACVRPIYFRTRCQSFTKAVSGKRVAYPPLMFVADPGRLSVWALRENAKPAADTQLCVAPFYNIYSNGAMCGGNARQPDVISTADLEDWERAFYSTEFTHTNAGAVKITAHPYGHAGLWYSIASRGLREFPVRTLVSAKKTVLEAINQ